MKGGENRAWVEPLLFVSNWRRNGTEIKVGHEAGFIAARPQNERYYLRRGIAVQTTGADFSARLHRYPSIFGDKARSVFPDRPEQVLALLNAAETRSLVEDLNPTIDFTVGDLKRVPYSSSPHALAVLEVIDQAFSEHEAHRETSVEFRMPGASPWQRAQEWAQKVIDLPKGEPLPDYVEELVAESATDHFSFALGVALGRFSFKGEGILDPSKHDLNQALPAGILFLDTTLSMQDRRDSLGHPATAPLLEAWEHHEHALGTNRGFLRAWLAFDFFKDVHKGMYENRPIHWPLSSASRTFVAFINIHRFNDQTLRILLGDHLNPTLSRLEGELTDLRAARDGTDKSALRTVEKRFEIVKKARDELEAFIALVEQSADRGAPPIDATCPPRERDAGYDPDLDDGVMINSAALWPLLEPQWKEPKKWWKEVSEAKGKKDYDWSHLAMRYWPNRVDKKCRADPSLAVAHGCFWRYHPARAWARELRLQDEIGEDFRIEEAPYRPGGRDVGGNGDRTHRDAYLNEHPEEALAAIEKEAVRRMGRGQAKRGVPELRILEQGFWSRQPRDVWDMELRLAQRQGSDFRLTSPDEPNARAAFMETNPELVEWRETLMASLAIDADLFSAQSEDAESSDEDAGDDALTDAETDEEEAA